MRIKNWLGTIYGNSLDREPAMHKKINMPTAMLIVSTILFSFGSTAQTENDEDIISYITVTALFDEVRSDIESAILNQSFVIDFNAKVGEMLNRTAPDVGISNPVYTHAETWQFCSAKLSHEMVLTDPLNIAFCPYVIFAYETVSTPGEITVGYRRPIRNGSSAVSDALNVIDSKLQDILNEISD